MPLYEHASGEREHTAPGSRRDQALEASDAWTLVGETSDGEPAEEQPADAQPARVVKRTSKATAEDPAPREG